MSTNPLYLADDLDLTRQIFVSVYDGITCQPQDLIDANVFHNNECSIPQAYYSNDLFFEVECANLSTSSSWTVNVYEGTTCTGTAPISLQGSGPCSCETLAYQGGSLSVKVNCAGTRFYPCQSYQNDTYYSYYYNNFYGRGALYGKVYEGSSCSNAAASTGHYFANDECLYTSSLGFKVNCNEPTSTSSWTAMVYPAANCSSSSVASLGTLSANGACACASGTFAETDYSLQVNCAGSKSFTCSTSSSTSSYSTAQVTVVAIGAAIGLSLIAVFAYWLPMVLKPQWIAAGTSNASEIQNQAQDREMEISSISNPMTRATTTVAAEEEEESNQNSV